MAHKQKYSRHPGFEPLTVSSQGQRPTRWPTLFHVYLDPDWYVPIPKYVRIGLWDIWTKNENSTRRWKTTRAPPGRVRRGEQSEARRAISTQNGGPHLELLQVVYVSKPGLNLTSRLLRRQGPTYWYLYTCLFLYWPQRYLRQDGQSCGRSSGHERYIPPIPTT